MNTIKTPQEIAAMTKAGKILASVLFEVLAHAQPGVSELELDALADRLITEKGGYPGFKKVSGWKHATCIATNDVIVHGIPTPYRLKEGDVIGIDCGVYLDGLHTDMSETVRVKGEGKNGKKDAVDLFIQTGKIALERAIEQVKPGNRVGHISQTIQSIIENGGYGVARNLIGHGVGRELHEPPEIPGYVTKQIHKTPELKPGMTIAVEVIYTMGDYHMVYDKDGWTIRTKDGSLSGLFERTVLVTENGHKILTK